MMPFRSTIVGAFMTALGALGLSAMTSRAEAQTLQQRGYRPVVQMREDVDPLARPIEQLDAGLRTTGERNNVYKALRGDPRLFYISEGVVAEFDRSDYRITRHGRVLQFIPPNTVFHIGLPPQPTSGTPRPPDPAQMVRGAVAAQVDGHVQWPGAVGSPLGSISPHRAASAEPSAPAGDTAWLEYSMQRLRQRNIVTAALTRSAPPAPSR